MFLNVIQKSDWNKEYWYTHEEDSDYKFPHLELHTTGTYKEVIKLIIPSYRPSHGSTPDEALHL